MRAQSIAPTTLATVGTLAGERSGKDSRDGAGAAAHFSWPMGIAVDASNTVYVVDEEANTIRKITPAGQATTLAGRPGTKHESQDGLGAAARFYHPVGLAVDAGGTLYVTDADNHTIRKITPQGDVTTLAGLAGHKGHLDGGPGTAQFNLPHGVAVAANGTVYVADTDNHTIRQLTPAGQVTTLAGLAGSAGSADGVGTQARFSHPSGIAVDASGTLYVADNGNYTVRKITPAGVVTTLAGLARHKGSAEGAGATARFHTPNGLAVDSYGTVYVADYINSVIRQITPRGEVTTFAGELKGWRNVDGPRAQARFEFPFGVAVGPNGWVYVADSGSRTIRVIR
jgi:sugar lactone lactonase YvrE